MLDLKLGRIGMNMEEATIKRWHKAVGETFTKGEPLYDIETEKVAGEVPAPFDGKLLEIVAQLEDIVEVGGVVCRVEKAE
jgi:pyruvate/2-oxoglutarate dehydrogenase complex dihydrolipoamide acyltransferase (E2) component